MPTVQANRGEDSNVSQVKELEIGVKRADLTNKNQNNKRGEWGRAEQVSEHTWTLRVGQDATTANAFDVLIALNYYRQTQGKGIGHMEELVCQVQQRIWSSAAKNCRGNSFALLT